LEHKKGNDETLRKSFMASSYIPSTILKGTLNFLQFYINQISVFTPLVDFILFGTNKNRNDLQKKIGSFCEDGKIWE
jgi:hypothetical protein